MTATTRPWESVAEAPDWTLWGKPRMGLRGVETAFHHTLVMIRARGGSDIRVVSPGDVFVGGDRSAVEWSPMLWALRGRRQWRSFGLLTPATAMRVRGDRLFHISNAVCEQLFEGGLLGARGLEGWTSALARRIDFCEARAIVYRHLVIPDGQAIYADAIPGAPKLSEQRPLMQILQAGGRRIRERVVYPLETMIAGRAKFETSLPHDVHFTGYGCFLCYRELVATLPNIDPKSVVREDELRARKIFLAGDVARGADEPGRDVEFHDAPHPKFNAVIKGTSFVPDQVDVLESENRNLPKLVMLRTSNATHLFPYLLRHFSRIVAVATINFHYDLIESERPDVIICEMPERYFAPVLSGLSETDHGVPPSDPERDFEKRTGHKLPLPQGDATSSPAI